MPYEYDKRLLFYKIETVEGTELAPVAADAIVTRGLQPVNFESDNRVREIDGVYFGARPESKATIRGRTSFEVEMTGGGTATGVPPWMKLNRIAGMNAGTVGASSVVQSPISTAVPSATLWDYTDTLRSKLLGSRADFRMRFEDDQYPFFAYDVLGFPPPAGFADDSAPVTPDVSAFQTPDYCNNANTIFLLDGYAAELRSVEYVAGSVLVPRSFIGSADRVKYRNRAWTATATIKCPTLATKNYFTSMQSGVVPMKITHGLTAGRIIEVESLRSEVGVIARSDEEGDLMLTIPLRLLPTTGTGNDEITITTK